MVKKDVKEDVPHTVRLTPRETTILDRIVKKGHASTISEAIRDAIYHYGKLLKVAK